MATFQTFEEIEAWQKARELTREIYAISNLSKFAKDFGLRDQIRRACISIMSNIAEGFERNGTGEFIHFLTIAKGSAGEVKSQLYTALDQDYISKEMCERLFKMVNETASFIGGLVSYLKKSKIKFSKHK